MTYATHSSTWDDVDVPKYATISANEQALEQNEAIETLETGLCDEKLKLRALDGISIDAIRLNDSLANFFEVDDLQKAREKRDAVMENEKIPFISKGKKFKSDISAIDSIIGGTPGLYGPALAALSPIFGDNVKHKSDNNDEIDLIPLFTKDEFNSASDDVRRKMMNSAKEWNAYYADLKKLWGERVEKLEAIFNREKQSLA